ncbi:hypothetical protein [Streptomyces sp. NPDC051561]|uniref:hypothetical protein n=1 Tax=Streptomyces sp. NPDC051561 TaxID=3365658 RepID=UPI0037B4CDAB
MDTSRRRVSRDKGRVWRYVESGRNLAGCAGGLAGLALTFTGVSGAYWPLVVVGLYGAGALIAPPERLAVPHFPDAAEQLGVLREDFGRLREYVASVELPPAAHGRAVELDGLLGALLGHEEWASDPDGFHVLTRAVREDVPEAVDTYLRARWWTRFTASGEPPERLLEHQLGLVQRELAGVAEGLRDAVERQRESHTYVLEERSDTGGGGASGAGLRGPAGKRRRPPMP